MGSKSFCISIEFISIDFFTFSNMILSCAPCWSKTCIPLGPSVIIYLFSICPKTLNIGNIFFGIIEVEGSGYVFSKGSGYVFATLLCRLKSTSEFRLYRLVSIIGFSILNH